MDVSMGVMGLLISLVYVGLTVLGFAVLIVGLIVLLKVNRLLSLRLSTTRKPVRPADHLSASPQAPESPTVTPTPPSAPPATPAPPSGPPTTAAQPTATPTHPTAPAPHPEIRD